ncbi:hypothetical protein EW146_g6803 [Bondarzewia mesenterica]|uniref:Uncharacterized protein n=1 Tax=Bondarzewia mesenterica TaxID=1095465 RepID=A0A4S4LPH2_9AGAM|nr:hypothetical protein EW146_g6803 [Bondarzewia mesenterica]
MKRTDRQAIRNLHLADWLIPAPPAPTCAQARPHHQLLPQPLPPSSKLLPVLVPSSPSGCLEIVRGNLIQTFVLSSKLSADRSKVLAIRHNAHAECIPGFGCAREAIRGTVRCEAVATERMH